eukprot:CAMPEP_0184660972 /NCGR_PEP_ID=MMETSP0308-20130426/36355_1 /TAXON_ID=38269 /ORGANISM="Gloeochaete witrockiana, Strain SAG 46.84" /LENGTH=313 /DNA_ID=CAMNT_0027101945 /DNA_START=73 /DNA_END=1011 /DNA_ORIENTATION=+
MKRCYLAIVIFSILAVLAGFLHLFSWKSCACTENSSSVVCPTHVSSTEWETDGEEQLSIGSVSFLAPLSRAAELSLFACLRDWIVDSSAGVAVIVEPRPHPLLKEVLQNVMSRLPPNWRLQIFVGPTSLALLRTEFDTEIKMRKILVTPLVNLSCAECLSKFDKWRYNTLLLSPHFWNRILHENVLLFQVDSWICSQNTSDIYKWMKYDFVGAPWDRPDIRGVGNGGFSLRKRSTMIRISQRLVESQRVSFAEDVINMPEDVVYATELVHLQYSVPSVEEAAQFSVEAKFHPTPFGVHQYWLLFAREHAEILW